MKICFLTVQALVEVRNKLMPFIHKNRERKGIYLSGDVTEYSNLYTGEGFEDRTNLNMEELILDIREYDIIYYTRVSIDSGIRVGVWYNIHCESGTVILTKQPQILERPQPKVLAFDIETTHLPLRFPDAKVDKITMISYMLDGQGYLIVNREIVSADIEDFEYTPKPEYQGPFKIYNSPNELDMLKYFFEHIRETKPNIFVSFNGDGFDWPFIDERCKQNKLNLSEEIGMKYNTKAECYSTPYAPHLDAFCWVQRDSYLPQGSQGLKAVTKAKLGYDPLSLDPEDMVIFASKYPQKLASYSVSDAVATYYLYKKYVDPFIFSLCTIIPMNPDDVLRKGSGTLCEALLMNEAFSANVIYPNKQEKDHFKTYKGHLLESETYIGIYINIFY